MRTGQTGRRDDSGMLTNFGLLSGLVPDGVATVTAAYPATQTTPALSTLVHVTNNVFVTNIPITHRDRQPTLTWRSADGAIIRTIPGVQRSTNPGFCGGRATSKPGTRPCQ